MRSSDEARPRSPGLTRGLLKPGSDGFRLRVRPALFTTALLATLGATAPGLRDMVSDERPRDEPLLIPLEIVPVASLPLEVNARVRYWMDRFKTVERPTFERFMAREGLYGEVIRQKLAERGMPEELIYLAMIESGFSTSATSPVAAVGLWQFMGPTAKQYGLRVDQWVDERRDPIRATDAALTYLEVLHERYDSWYLAAAAYNTGPARVDRALRRRAASTTAAATTTADIETQEGADVDLYWQIIDQLPRETREHVPRLLAVTLLARESEENGFDVERLRAYTYDRVWVPGGTRLTAVARALEVPARELRDLNPHLIRGTTPPGGSYGLRVPVGRTAQVVASIGGGPWGSRRVDD